MLLNLLVKESAPKVFIESIKKPRDYAALTSATGNATGAAILVPIMVNKTNPILFYSLQ
jgi:hypothetical protein